jgi:GNAT superfamily N-acetyltransferase
LTRGSIRSPENPDVVGLFILLKKHGDTLQSHTMAHGEEKLIRPVCSDDIETLQGLFSGPAGRAASADGVRDRREHIGNTPENESYVCEEEGRICGAMTFRIQEDIGGKTRSGEVVLLVSGSLSRSRGAGRVLLAWAEELAREKGCWGIRLESAIHGGEDAQRFFRPLGYTLTGRHYTKPLSPGDDRD